MTRQPFKGSVKVGKHSSLKKLMRGAARGKLNPIALDRINLAQKVASDRAKVYMHAAARVDKYHH